MPGVAEDLEALGRVLTALESLDDTKRRWVIGAAMANLGLLPVDLSPLTLASVGPAQGNAAQPLVSPKDFLRQKNPRTDVQRIACLAYFLTYHRAQPHFKTRDLTAINVEAAGPRLSNPSFAVSNATKQSHYLAAAGGGSKQITALGEEVVNALPDQSAVTAIGGTGPRRKARRSRRRAPGKATLP
jgi:hypothetical protein